MRYVETRELYEIYKLHPSISKDTREITKGCIYFSLKGESFDGNKFANDALAKGAAYVVIDDPKFKKGDEYLLVPDSLKALQDLAVYHRNQLTIPVIGITGSNGKTTTKELIASVLSRKFKIHSTKGNYNNHIGVPLTLLQINNKHEIAVVEMGANHQGEIDFLSNISQPNYGMITNIGKAHLEGFGGIEGVKKGKTELYRFLEKTHGKVFINEDDTELKSLCPKLDTISYSKNRHSYCWGLLNQTHPHLTGSWECKNQKGEIQSSLYGEYNFYNILAAICIGNYFKVESEKIDEAINEYQSDINRSQLIEKDGYTVYLDAYNANPTSMGLAIQNFEKNRFKNKILILGDMFELGEESKAEHKKIINQVKNSNQFLISVFVGKNFFYHKESNSDLIFFETTKEVKEWFSKNNKKDESYLIKGSRGMALEGILE